MHAVLLLDPAVDGEPMRGDLPRFARECCRFGMHRQGCTTV
jgi:hypothetical protein